MFLSLLSGFRGDTLHPSDVRFILIWLWQFGFAAVVLNPLPCLSHAFSSSRNSTSLPVLQVLRAWGLLDYPKQGGREARPWDSGFSFVTFVCEGEGVSTFSAFLLLCRAQCLRNRRARHLPLGVVRLRFIVSACTVDSKTCEMPLL